MIHGEAEGGRLDEIAEELEEIERRSPLARTLVTVVITVVVLGLLIGGVLALSAAMRETRTAVNAVDLEGAAQVSIRSASADVRLVEGDSDLVTVTAEVTSGLLETTYELRRRGEEIEVVAECLAWLSPDCGVTVTVELPPGLPVLVATGSGDVAADAVVERVLTVATGSGNITGQDLVLDELSARTDSGRVDVGFAEEPYAVKARTDSGAVAVRLPAGERSYALALESASGAVSSDLEHDADGGGFMRLRTGSGDIGVQRE